MLVVLAIIGLVVALVLPNLRRPPDNLRLEAATRTVASVLRLLRSQAIARNADVVLTIDADRRIFESSTGSAIQLDHEISVELIFAAPERRACRGRHPLLSPTALERWKHRADARQTPGQHFGQLADRRSAA
jgi:type II secretory pathway pseudopilin PulG